MPPKEVTNIINGTLYFEDENGELKPICMASEVLGDDLFQFANNVLSTDQNCEDLVSGLFRMLPEYHFSFDLDRFTYKMLVRSHSNNYRRLHGLRPVRYKVQRHKPENSLFAVKRMRGGFKFK